MKMAEAQALFAAQKRVFLGRFVGEEISDGQTDDGRAYARHVVHVYSDKDVLHVNIKHPKNLNKKDLIPALNLKEFDSVIVHLQDVTGSQYGERLTGSVQPVTA